MGLNLGYNPQGWPQAQEGVGKCSLEALASRVWKLWTWCFGILFNILALWKNIIGIFYTNFRASLRLKKVLENGALRPWNPQFLSLSHDVLCYVQNTRPLKNHYWYFLIPLSGPASGLRRCWEILGSLLFYPQGQFQAQENHGKMESWCPSICSIIYNIFGANSHCYL